MDPKWAADNLQTIRTLMERSAVYRRALAPVMIFIGVIGLAGSAAGWRGGFETPQAFVFFWFAIAGGVLIGSFLLIRLQALRDNEPFWSPPTRRMAQAITPPLVAGFVSGLVVVLANRLAPDPANWPVGQMSAAQQTHLLPVVWGILYGCALYSAGFFMPRGMKVFGFAIVLISLLALAPGPQNSAPANIPAGHALMGFIFGICHLAYGAYLYLTEKGKNAA
jgi:hypothetical protein